MLTIEKISKFSDVLELKDIWNSLLERSDCNIAYLTHEWFCTAYEYLDKDKELSVLLIRDENEVIGIAPLLLSKERIFGLPVKRIGFVKNANTPYQDFILIRRKEECFQLILHYLKRNSWPWCIVELHEMRDRSENIKILQKLCKSNNFFFNKTFQSYSWYLLTNSSWEEGLAKVKPRVRKEFRRKLARLEHLGELKVEIVTEIADIKKHLEVYLDFHARTWKGRESNPEFYFKIAEHFARKRKLLLYVLLLNNRPVSYLYSIKSGKILFGLKTSYDPSYFAFSPGIALFYKSIQKMFHDRDIGEFDIGRGDERFKREWASVAYEQSSVILGRKDVLNCIYFPSKFTIAPFCRDRIILKNVFSGLKVILNTYKQAKKGVKKAGLLGYLWSLIRKSIALIYSKTEVYIFEKKISGARVKNRPDDGLLFRFAELDDVIPLVVATEARNLKDIENRLENNEKCLLVTDGQEILYYFWLTPRRFCVEQVNRQIRLGNNELCLQDFKGPNSLRDIDLFAKVFEKVCIELSQENYGTILAASNKIDSYRNTLLESLGFQVVEKITGRRFFGPISARHY
ncbi:MAG: GNAT family N-acetyltransferase [Candidatus Hodarchaeota archaeon]